MTTVETHLPAHQLRQQVERIAQSKPFICSRRMQRFLSYIVEAELTNSRDSLKESILGVEVFDRTPGFDPKEDPIVRVEARRLRAKLQEYYDNYGVADPVFIQVPKGGYIPEIVTRRIVEPTARQSTFSTMIWQYAAAFVTGLR